MRRLAVLDAIKLYFLSWPRGLGFLPLLVLIGIVGNNYFGEYGILAAAGSAALIVLIIFLKTKNFIKYNSLFRNGVIAHAELVGIKNTFWEMNDNKVIKYTFKYQVGDADLRWQVKRSRMWKNLETGQQFLIFYDPMDPKNAFIPEMLGVSNLKADMDGPQNY